MSLNIIQWNINGFKNNYNELLELIKIYSPKIISLQETHLQSFTNTAIPINFHAFAYNTSNTRYGGVALLIHKSLQHEQIIIPNDFDSICVEVHSKLKFKIISSYIPPNKNFTQQNLENVFNNTQAPIIVTGDFNCWHNTWGSPINNRKGRILSQFINDNDLILLNNSSPTHFSTHSTFTNVDLSFCSPSLSVHTDWKITTNLYGSDHFPIIISLFHQSNQSPSIFRPLYKFSQANWCLFKKQCISLEAKRPQSDNVNKETANICKIIKEAANISIPQTHPRISKNIIWWNSFLESLKREKK